MNETCATYTLVKMLSSVFIIIVVDGKLFILGYFTLFGM